MSSLGSRLIGAAAGAAAGLVATAVMSAVIAAPGRDRLGEPPPEKIVRRAAPSLDSPRRKALAGVAHVAFGTGAGAVFGLLTGRRRRSTLGAALNGIGFGLAVWAISYEGWVPALDIMPPAHRDHPPRAETMLAAHVVYGAVLGVLTAD